MAPREDDAGAPGLPRVLVLVVAYNAERFVGSVLERIPARVWDGEGYRTQVLVLDDGSTDRTPDAVEAWRRASGRRNLLALAHPVNQGYGGNQKIGYHYAITRGFDHVVLLHGDGQYPPELLPELLAPLLADRADVVLGSRMLEPRRALAGGMPFYKWVGNQVLTAFQNLVLGARLAEFHTGYRAYRVAALAGVPFAANADGFGFDTDILIQMLQTGRRIRELSIPTHYGDEVCHVDGVRYALEVAWTSVRARIQPLGILYDPRFDYAASESPYRPKLGYASSHQLAVDRVRPGETVLDLGSGPGDVVEAMAAKGARVVAVDREIAPRVAAAAVGTVAADLETFDFRLEGVEPDRITALDVLEHLAAPERFLAALRARYGDRAPAVLVTTPNVAFVAVRLGLLLGTFNYGRRGILDMDHKRLFTFASLRRLLEAAGYEVRELSGIPAPFPLALGDGLPARALLALNQVLIRVAPGLFAYQLACVARPKPTLEHLLARAAGGEGP